MKKRIVCLLLAMVMLLSVTAGCGNKAQSDQTETTAADTTSANTPVPADSTKETSTDEKITLRYSWWGAEDRHQATLKAIENYTRQHPNITVEPEYGAFSSYLDKLYVQLASKTVPDLFAIDNKWVQDFIRNYKDSFINLKDLPQIDLSQTPQEFQEKFLGGKDFTIGATTGINTFGFIYSQEFFDKFNLGDPSHWTWEDYIENGKKVVEQDPQSHLVYNILNNFGYIFKFRIKQKIGTDIVGEDYNIVATVDDFEWGWEYIKELFDSGTVPPLEESMPYATSFPDQVPNFIEGKYAMHFTQISNLASLIPGLPFNMKTAYLPILEDAKDVGWPTAPAIILSVYAYGEHTDEAAKLLDYSINDEEAIKIFGCTRGLPISEKALDILEKENLVLPEMKEFLDHYMEQTKNSYVAENAAILNNSILKLTTEFAQNVGYGKMTPREAAEGYMKELEKICKTSKEAPGAKK